VSSVRRHNRSDCETILLFLIRTNCPSSRACCYVTSIGRTIIFFLFFLFRFLLIFQQKRNYDFFSHLFPYWCTGVTAENLNKTHPSLMNVHRRYAHREGLSPDIARRRSGYNLIPDVGRHPNRSL